MKIFQFIRKFLSAFILLSFMSSSVLAVNSQSNNENFAIIQGDASGVFWVIHPDSNYQAVRLTLSRNCGGNPNCDGIVTTSVSEQEPSTGALVDGSYNYELLIIPAVDASIREELKAIREAAGGQEVAGAARALRSQGVIPQRRQVQSGHFLINGGQLVSADTVEE